ncbi:MAG: carbonic anhydrase [Pyrinomonadaceae bacterium]
MDKLNIFATAINCIDGRAQLPVSDWLRLHTGADYVDTITEPGANEILSNDKSKHYFRVFEKLKLSINAHQPRVIAVAGHYDCLANPVSFETHIAQIKKGADRLDSLNMGIRIVGLYVNEWGAVDLVFDSTSGHREMRSFL